MCCRISSKHKSDSEVTDGNLSEALFAYLYPSASYVFVGQKWFSKVSFLIQPYIHQQLSLHDFVDKIHNLKHVEYTHNPGLCYSAGVGTEVKSLEVQGVPKYCFPFSLCASKFIVFCCRSLPPSTGIPSEGKEHAARIPYSQLDCL